MATDVQTTGDRNSNTLARERDALILRLLDRHPATAGMLTELRLFPTRKKASKRLMRLLERQMVRRLGTVSLKDGRPEHVYGRGRWKTDNLLHEVQLTRVLLKIDANRVKRGPGEVDPVLLPDAELWIASKRLYLELDMGTMSTPDVVGTRFPKYRDVPDFVLWVCPSLSRLEALRSEAQVLRDTALFTTLDQALQGPHTPIWIDADGERAALPRGRQSGTEDGIRPGDKGEDKPGTLSPPASGVPTNPVQSGAGQPTVGPDRGRAERPAGV